MSNSLAQTASGIEENTVSKEFGPKGGKEFEQSLAKV